LWHKFFSSFLKPILVSVCQRYGIYCHNVHFWWKKQVVLEIDLPILQGELGCWNYLILKEFSEISTPKRVHVAIETRPQFRLLKILSGLLNPPLDRFSPVRNVKRYCRKAYFNALPVVQVREVSSARSSSRISAGIPHFFHRRIPSILLSPQKY
jgi:hypothetical protein